MQYVELNHEMKYSLQVDCVSLIWQNDEVKMHAVNSLHAIELKEKST